MISLTSQIWGLGFEWLHNRTHKQDVEEEEEEKEETGSKGFVAAVQLT